MSSRGLNVGGKKIRWEIFLPPWILVIAILVLNLTNYETFIVIMDAITAWILGTFSWLFNLVTFLAVIAMFVTYFSPIKNVRFGGSKSKPMMKYSDYMWIALCTILAAGILLWACAEPMYHSFLYPPAHVTAGAGSWEANLFAMEVVFLEWTFSPMAIYGIPSLLFAFVFYNMKTPYAVSSMFIPFIGEKKANKINPFVDGICLFALCAGMAASLGSGILLLSGGLDNISNGAIQDSHTTWIICGVLIIAAFIISAISGVMNGIRILSTINSKIYIVLGIVIFLLGPSVYILDLLTESVGVFIRDFAYLNLWTSVSTGDGWASAWPVFFWCNYLAWMPVTATFLGRISKGYSVKEAIEVLFFFPSVFSMFWLAIFSGSAIYYELNGAGIATAMTEQGTAAATYSVFNQIPMPVVTTGLFLFIVFVSYVTAADSNTNAMSGLCTADLTAEDTESPTILKIVWGGTIGALCIIMLIAFDVEGLKKLSNLGGLPNLFIMILAMISWMKVCKNPKKYDLYKEDYTAEGVPIPSKRIKADGEKEKAPETVEA